jgi:DNA-binding SARP family transcriptional activator
VIRLRTLGTLDLRGFSGDELRPVLAQPRRAALLVYLALATPRGAHRRDTVLALFWPELDTNHARNALGQAVHFLRRSIAADVIVNRNGDGLSIDWSSFWCDAAAFEDALEAERVGEALALYRGDLLEGFHIGEAPDFERWLESERARLAARYTKALEAVANDREEAGDFDGAATHWRVLATRDPYSSRLTLRLMRALRAAGDPAGAIVQARQHERLLREELGIAPDAVVATLVRQLQAEQPDRSFSTSPVLSTRAANDGAGTADRPAAEPVPPGAVRPRRRRTATLATGFLAVCVLAGTAVLKGSSRYAPAAPAAAASRAPGASNVSPNETYLSELYDRGRNAERSRSEIGLATAREAYEHTVGRDSTFALGYAGLAGVYGLLGHYGFMPLRPALDSARMMARRALALDSTLSETRSAVATTLADAGKFELAEREFERAIRLDSSDAVAALQYSLLLVALGRGEDAQRESRRAAQLDPLVSRGVLAVQRHAHWLLTGKRPHFLLPVRERRPSLELEPGDPWALARQAEDFAQTGECADARLDIERAKRLAPDNVRMRPFMGRVDWWCGERARARALLDDMKRRPDASDNSFDIALLHTFFGEKDSAFVWLESHRQWTVIELAMLSAAHYLDPLRADPRFPRLLRNLGLRK